MLSFQCRPLIPKESGEGKIKESSCTSAATTATKKRQVNNFSYILSLEMFGVIL